MPTSDARAAQLARLTEFDASRWNPRYLAYCRAQGAPDPRAMLALDEVAWPGGIMCGFIIWTSERIREFRAAAPDAFLGPAHELVDQMRFDAWLAARYTDNSRLENPDDLPG